MTIIEDTATELAATVTRAVEAARADERRKVGLWLEQQAAISRTAPNGVHPEAGTRTQAAVLMWTAARVLAGDI